MKLVDIKFWHYPPDSNNKYPTLSSFQLMYPCINAYFKIVDALLLASGLLELEDSKKDLRGVLFFDI